MVKLFCPQCKLELAKEGLRQKCGQCGFFLEEKDGIFVSGEIKERDKEFYDKIYDEEHGQKWFQGLNRSFLKRVLEKISLGYRRERFFKRNIHGKENLILDLACGAGRDYFKDYGTVVGVDLSFKPLEIAKNRYDVVVQGGVEKLPFADGTFDYVTSSDFFGHVRDEDKDKIMKEIRRVLKPGGKTLHIIETDSENYLYKFAHRYPDLFQKYFIEKIGGHVGLEMPSACANRWEQNGFELVMIKKIWGTIWPIKDYASFFNNEYKEKSIFIRAVVIISLILGKIKLVEVFVNIILNTVNSLVGFFTNLNHGNGLMLVEKKPNV